MRVWLWVLAALAGSVTSVSDANRPTLRLATYLGGALVAGLAFGFATWWFTRFVIDGTELRVDSGILTKRSRRIPYERLQSVDIAQPFGARIFGLAELRMEMAGGEDSRTRLQFLSRSDAEGLRAVLLEQAHLRGATESRTAGDAAHEVDAGGDPLIASVGPLMLVLATVVSLDFVLAAGIVIVVLTGSLLTGHFVATVSLIVPFGAWVGGIVMRRVVAQWGCTLSRRPRGLRIERGLLGTVSQTVPFDRVQGISIQQPVVWRVWGWRRVDVDIAGYADKDDDRESSSTVLPVGPPQTARTVARALLPAIDADTMPLVHAPRRSQWLAPLGWRFRAAGLDDHGFVAHSGWVVHDQDVVPHHKTQSVELAQGPLQRLLHLATVSVHTPDGPVDAKGHNLAPESAATLARSAVDHARSARATP